jgi:hypothetical protein
VHRDFGPNDDDKPQASRTHEPPDGKGRRTDTRVGSDECCFEFQKHESRSPAGQDQPRDRGTCGQHDSAEPGHFLVFPDPLDEVGQMPCCRVYHGSQMCADVFGQLLGLLAQLLELSRALRRRFRHAPVRALDPFQDDSLRAEHVARHFHHLDLGLLAFGELDALTLQPHHPLGGLVQGFAELKCGGSRVYAGAGGVVEYGFRCLRKNVLTDIRELQHDGLCFANSVFGKDRRLLQRLRGPKDTLRRLPRNAACRAQYGLEL